MNQQKFDPLDYVAMGYTDAEAHKAALRERNSTLKLLRKLNGKTSAKGWTLRDQLRPYASFGVPDGRVRNVYYINNAAVQS
jgi:hypothetical protein